MESKEVMAKIMKVIRLYHNPNKKDGELGNGENNALHTIYMYKFENNKDITPGELCAINKLTSGRVASILKSLEKKNCIQRKASCKDHRKILIQLTHRGEELAKNNFEKSIKSAENIVKKLGEKDALEFVRLLNLIIK